MLTGKTKVFRIKEKFKSRVIRMKIKAADIARNLNLSKATVSLVLNNKPGVSEKTRRRIFDYIEDVSGEAERQKEEKEALLEEKMDRWVYLNDLAEQIEAQK